MAFPPRSRHTTCAALLVAFGGVVCASLALSAQGGKERPITEPDSFGLAAGAKVLWAYARGPTDEVRELRFAYRAGGDERTGRFAPARLAPIQGTVVRAAVAGECLHVFFRDGAHMQYAPAVPWRSAAPDAATIEAVLPGNALPAALAADAGTGALVALVQAAAAPPQQVDAPTSEDRLAEPPTPDTEDGGLAPTAEVGESGVDEAGVPPAEAPWVVVRYDNARWVHDRGGPLDVSADAEIVQLLASAGAVHLLYRAQEDSSLLHRISTDATGPWSDARPVPVSPNAAVLAAGWLEGAPLVVAGRVENGAAVLTIHRFAGGRWDQGTALSDGAGGRVRLAAPLAAGVFESQLVVARRGADGRLEAGAWSLIDGRQKSPFAVIRPLVPSAEPLVSTETRVVLEFVAVAVLLTTVFAWRRDRFLVAAPIARDQLACGLTRRGIALLIDVVVLLPACIVAFFLVFGEDEVSGGFGAWVDPERAAWMRARVILLTSAMLAVYAAAFEAAIGQTPGKRLAGCRVVGEDGGRCGLMPILIRNAARIAEFYFLPLVILVPLTRSRQRLGDLLARTVVVEPLVLPPTSRPPDSADQGPEAEDHGLGERDDAADEDKRA